MFSMFKQLWNFEHPNMCKMCYKCVLVIYSVYEIRRSCMCYLHVWLSFKATVFKRIPAMSALHGGIDICSVCINVRFKTRWTICSFAKLCHSVVPRHLSCLPLMICYQISVSEASGVPRMMVTVVPTWLCCSALLWLKKVFFPESLIVWKPSCPG